MRVNDTGFLATAGGEIRRCTEDVFMAGEEALFWTDAEGDDGGS